MAQKCPRCGNEAEELATVDDRLMEKLKEGGSAEPPRNVCIKCFTALAGSVARGSVLLAQEKAKENHKLMLWKSRVTLIKSARALMSAKSFSDAAVVYEKYIRILEIIFESGAGGLKAEHFKDSARTNELTVLASVYWDLIRIYDTSPKYGERMRTACNKLSQLLKYTPLYPDVIRKAEAFQRGAKNPAVIKGFLKAASESKGRCFIATAVFESEDAEPVLQLRLFRDLILDRFSLGRILVRFYYNHSPGIALRIEKKPAVRRILWLLLVPTARIAQFIRVTSCQARQNLSKSSWNGSIKRSQK